MKTRVAASKPAFTAPNWNGFHIGDYVVYAEQHRTTAKGIPGRFRVVELCRDGKLFAEGIGYEWPAWLELAEDQTPTMRDAVGDGTDRAPGLVFDGATGAPIDATVDGNDATIDSISATVDGNDATIVVTKPEPEKALVVPPLDDLVRSLASAQERVEVAESAKKRASDVYKDAVSMADEIAHEITRHYGPGKQPPLPMAAEGRKDDQPTGESA